MDYFQPTLEPWKHYIPIRLDLSDALEKVEFVMSDENQDVVRRIISNAQAWCTQRLVSIVLRFSTIRAISPAGCCCCCCLCCGAREMF